MDFILLEYLGVDKVQATTLVRLIDRMHKLEGAEFRGLLDGIFSPSQREEGLSAKLDQILTAKKLQDLPVEVLNRDEVRQLIELTKRLESIGIKNAAYDPTLMRGFDYYTNIVFEVFDTDPTNNRSMFGGGRYDGLVGQFGVEPVATAGFGMGDVTFQNFLEAHELLPDLRSNTDIYVILIGDVFERAQKTLKELREMGVKVAVDTTGRKMDKQIKTALKKQIPYALFIGNDELKNEQFKLKDLAAGEEETHSVQRLVSIVKDHRRK